jgi:hypothetical protein
VAVTIDGHRFFSLGLPLRIYDWLSHVDGWHKERALATDLGADLSHVRRSLYRLQGRGAVEHRRPQEWRAA